MHDIKRSELADKLAAGWEVRRKSWQVGIFIKADDPFKITREDWAADDWEGGLAAPKRLISEVSFWSAVEKLRHGRTSLNHIVTHIRRKTWLNEDYVLFVEDGCVWNAEKKSRQKCDDGILHIQSLNTTDWEVWGYE